MPRQKSTLAATVPDHADRVVDAAQVSETREMAVQ
jgi:hypothetical protein